MFRLICSNAYRWIVHLLIVVSGLLAAGQAAAENLCSTGAYTVNVPLSGGVISAGSEFPEGGIVRAQQVLGLRNVTCDNYGQNNYTLSNGELYPGSENIYQTGVNGLGVRFRSGVGNKLYPFTTVETGNWFTVGEELKFTMELVKMGPLSGGSVDTTKFPRVEVNSKYPGGIWKKVAFYNIIGSFVLRIPTCTTPDSSWDLGTTSTSKLKSVGDASLWVDTPVTLTGCSTFHGNNSNGSMTIYTPSGVDSGSTSDSKGRAPNTLTMKLRANTDVIDSEKGIVGLDDKATASGFGVQVASKQSGDYVAQSLSGSIVVTPSVGFSGKTVTFPLGARIIRTDEAVSGGTISASLTYTIDYQ